MPAAGRYELSLGLAEISKQDVATTRFSGTLPNLELKVTRRNDRGLEGLAKASGGRYQLPELGSSLLEDCSRLVSDHSIESISALDTDKLYKRKLNFCLYAWFMIFLTGGWLIRRLHQLA